MVDTSIFDHRIDIRPSILASIFDHRSSTIDLRPSIIDLRPSTIDLRRSTHRSSVIRLRYLRSSTFDHRSSTIDLRPSTIDLRLSIIDLCIDHRPSTIDHRPSTFDHRSSHRPSTIDHRSSTIDHRSSHRSSNIDLRTPIFEDRRWKHRTDNPTSHRQFVTEYCPQWRSRPSIFDYRSSIFASIFDHRSSTIDLRTPIFEDRRWKHRTDNPTSHRQFVTEYCPQWRSIGPVIHGVYTARG